MGTHEQPPAPPPPAEQDPAEQGPGGIQWRQGLLGGLAVLTGLVVVLVMLAGRPFLPRR